MSFCKHRVMDRCKKDNRPCIFSKDCFEEEETKPQTNADRIRAMSDEELVEAMCSLSALDVLVDFCQRKPECDAMLETKDGVPDELCKACLLEWLRKPAEEGKNNG